MPLKPHKDESQREFMARCMGELAESPTERPQEQMVAICLGAWRDEHGGSPPGKADIAGWQARLKDLLAELTAKAKAKTKTSIKIDQVFIPGEVGEDGLPVNYSELLALLDQTAQTKPQKEPGKPQETNPTALTTDKPTDASNMSTESKRAEPGSPEAKRPYGKVDYADPGYQEDKVKRYPIDNEQHIRAAWNYIHKEKNQTPYTRDEVKRIKQKIVRAWKRVIDEEGPPGLEDDPHLGKRAKALAKSLRKQDDDEEVDVPEPEEDEGHEAFINRCLEEVTDQDVSEGRAESMCALAWENRSGANRIRHKVHAEAVSSDLLFCLSDSTPDRMGDVINPDGWSLENFQKNPIALFNHRSDFVIGKWKDLHVTNKQLRGHLVLAPEGTSDRIDEIRKLIAADILKAVSVGFKPIHSERRMEGDRVVGEFFKRQELVETSLVSVPANPNALSIAKSLNVSADTLDLVFAPSTAPRSKTVDTGSHPGKHAAVVVMRKKGGDTMSPLTQRISDLETQINAKRDRLKDHLSSVDDTNVSDTQLQITEEMHQSIGQDIKQLHMLRESEKVIGESTQQKSNGDGTHRAMIVHGSNGSGRSGAIPATKDARMDIIVRAGVAAAIAHVNKCGIEQARLSLMNEYPRYGDDCTKAFCEFVSKADVRPATTFQSTWAAELVQQLYADLMELLLPQAVFPRLSGMGLTLSFGRAGRISVPRRDATPSIHGSFVGEGQPIPVRRAGFAAEILTPKKMAVITTWTREIGESSVPAIEGLLRNAIQEDTAIAIDSVLLDDMPATAIRPAGLLNGVTAITGSTAGGFAAIVADLKAVIGGLLSITHGNIRKLVLLMNPQQSLGVSLATMPGLSAFPFMEAMNQGKLLTYQVIESGTVPEDTIIAVDAADFVTVGGEAPRFEVSDQATLHYDDDAPGDIDGSSPVRSLWQTDSIGLRLILPLNWTMRRPGVVAAVEDVTW